MSDIDTSRAALEALAADVLASAEHAPSALAWPNQTVARLADALTAQAARAERAEALLREAEEMLQDLLDDCEPDRPGAPRLSIREAARALAAKMEE